MDRVALDAAAAAAHPPRRDAAPQRPVEAETRHADGERDEQRPATATVRAARAARAHVRRHVVVVVVYVVVVATLLLVLLLLSLSSTSAERRDEVANAADARADLDGRVTPS